MAAIARKRLRSEESPYCIQTKIHINQRILDQTDSNKMQQIHAKTVRKLFDAVRQVSNATNAIEVSNESTKSSLPLWQQISLYGDGRVEFRNIPTQLSGDRCTAKCCAGRESFVQEHCTNCVFDLCENCGFSCLDCGRFLCRTCVGLFGCGTMERPICESCAIFN